MNTTTDTPEAAAKRPMPTIGKWRPAAALKEDWQILKTKDYEETGEQHWITVTLAMQVTRPARVAWLTFDDGTRASVPTDKKSGYEFFTRTPGEAERAAKKQEAQP